MTIEDFQKVVEFSLSSGDLRIRVLGGEPTLHPQFIELLKSLEVHKNIGLYVMTNGIMSSEKVDALFEYGIKRQVSFLCNVTYTEKDTDHMLKQREYFFKKMGRTVIPSITVYDYNIELSHPYNLIVKYDLNKQIRVGLAHPILGVQNKYLDPKYFKAFNIHFNIQREYYLKKGVFIIDDCGMPKCGVSNSNSFCRPVLDVGVNLDVWSCFPLINFKKVKLTGFRTVQELEAYFRNEIALSSKSVLFEECNECRSKQICCGGCLAHRINL